MNNGDLLDSGVENSNSLCTDGGVREKLKDLHISDLNDQPAMKKQKIEYTMVEFPSHDCEEGDSQFIETCEAEEQCCACGKVAVDPYVSQTCGHVFGRAAIKALERESITLTRCPGKDFDNEQCKEGLEMSKLKPDRALHRSILKKSVKCSNNNLGCTSTMEFRLLKSHLSNTCLYADVKCPSCTEMFPRYHIEDHTNNCKSKTCDFAEVGCSHVTSSKGKSSRSSSREHSHGLHLALLYQKLASALSLAKLNTKSIDQTIEDQSEDVVGQEELLRMMGNLGHLRSEAMQIDELKTNFINKRLDTSNHLQSYGVLLSQDFAVQVAEPALRVKSRGQYLERQEEGTSEDVKKLLKETIEVPILLNQGSIIFKVDKFSEKRTKAIKGELKRGIYGPQFYTHEFGYLMVPILYPNGDGGGAGTHLSIFIAIKKGKYDSLLTWPIMGRITISILSQKKVGRESVRHSFRTDITSLSYHRPTSEMNQASGIPKALDLALLKQPSDYLVDDTLFIQIVVDPKIN